MRDVLVLTLPEIEEGVMRVIQSRPSHRGKFIGAIEFLVDNAATDERLRLRANVTFFDKQETARKYHEALTKPKEDAA